MVAGILADEDQSRADIVVSQRFAPVRMAGNHGRPLKALPFITGQTGTSF
jgi:hypothetical protein